MGRLLLESCCLPSSVACITQLQLLQLVVWPVCAEQSRALRPKAPLGLAAVQAKMLDIELFREGG